MSDELHELERRLTALEASFDAHLRECSSHRRSIENRLEEGNSQFASIERRLSSLEALQGVLENRVGDLSHKVDRLDRDMRSSMSGLTTEVGLCIEYMRESARAHMTQTQIELFEAEARAKHRHEPPQT